jgi:peroxiredoxin
MPAYEADRERFAGHDAQVLGISVDSSACNAAWAESLGGLSYDLLSDFHPKGEVAKAYGVWREADGFSDRAIFVVGKDGRIAYANVHEIGDPTDNEVLFEALRKL